MVSRTFIIVIFMMVMFLQGCSNTAKGFSEGFKEDWRIWREKDGWIQEHMW